MSGRQRQVATDAEKVEALRIADEHGPAEASRRTGITAGTIKSWRSREGKAGPPKGESPVDWAERKRRTAEGAYSTSIAALVRVRKSLEAGNVREAKDAALTFATLLDKSGQAEQAVARAQQHQVKLDEAHASLLADTITAIFRHCGLPWKAAGVASVVRHHLLHATAGDERAPAPERDAARREARAAALADASLDELVELVERARALVPEGELPALPAPHPDAENGEQHEGDGEAAKRAELGAPSGLVKATRESRANAAGERSGRPGRKRRPGYVVQPDGRLRLMTDEEHEQLEHQRGEELAKREGRPPPPDCYPEAGTVR